MSDSNTVDSTDPLEVLGCVAELLEATARRVWAEAEAEGPLSAAYTRAQDIHLTAALAAGLVPAEVQALQDFELTGPGGPEAALREAVALLRRVPIESLPPGASHLLVRVAELVREVRG